MKNIIIRGKKLDPPQELFTCDHCGCFFETDEYCLLKKPSEFTFDAINYFETTCPQCGKDVRRHGYSHENIREIRYEP